MVLTAPVSDDEAAELQSLATARRGVVVVGVGLPDAGARPRDRGHDGWVRVAGWSVLAARSRPPGSGGRRGGGGRGGGCRRPGPLEAAAAADGPPDQECSRSWAAALDPDGPGARPVDVVDPMAAGGVRAGQVAGAGGVGGAAPAAATRAGARAALWDRRRPTSFSNVVSEARRALARGVTARRRRWWPGYAERLPLHAGVVLDADLVAAPRAGPRCRWGGDGRAARRCSRWSAARHRRRSATCGQTRGPALDADAALDDGRRGARPVGCLDAGDTRGRLRPRESVSKCCPGTKSSWPCDMRAQASGRWGRRARRARQPRQAVLPTSGPASK